MSRPTRFGQMLRCARDSSGYKSRRSFASDCGLAGETVRNYESGKALPSNQALMQMLKVLGVDPDTENGTGFITALHEDRTSRLPPDKRSYGVAANYELRKYLDSNDISVERVEQLVSLFLEYLNPNRQSESFKHFLRQQITKILE